MDILLVFGCVLLLGFFAGSAREKNHLRTLASRETELQHIQLSNLKSLPLSEQEVAMAQLVSGSTVLAADYFKIFVASLLNLIGGRISAYESLMDRARREAVVRLQAEAQALGADRVIHLRIETVNLAEGGTNRNVAYIEAVAYGTAIRYHAPRP